jgi:hypothetical protein
MIPSDALCIMLAAAIDPAIRIATNMMKRQGAIMLPMLRGFAIARLKLSRDFRASS